MADPENVKAIIRLRPPLQIVQPLNSSASEPHYVPRQTRLYSSEHSPPSCPYTLQPENASIHAGGSWFTFDGVHPPSTSTAEIYQSHIASMIQDAVAGYNSTLFAYGATGSGKSYSMIGSEKEDGIMQRAIEDVFDLVEQDQDREYVVRASYLEIYNEQLRDLLATDRPPPLASNGSAHQNIPKVHEDRQGRIFVRPLVSTPCADPEDVMRLLLSGESRRRVERTEWNLHSSRSHTIFSLTLESRPVNGPATFPITSSTMRQVTRQSSRTQLRSDLNPLDPPSVTSPSQPSPSTCEVFLGTGIGKMPITPSVTRFKSSTASSKSSGHVPDGSIRISQLNLVDLAGSEKLTDNEARNKEASYIKKSLLALQSVVSSLTELGTSTSSSNQSSTKQRLLHVPYRNSQLTRLLQTSLSGNAKVAFLCTISPDPDCEIETLSTLRFAAGAKKVETRAEMGQVVDRATLLEALESKVLELEAALMTNADYTEALERERDEAIERADGAEKICDDYESKLAELQTLRTPLKEQHDHLKRLILTGSPRSSYATANTLELHTNNQHPGGPATTTGLIRKKSVGTKRPSRLSEAATGPVLDTPTKRVGWKELFFDEHPGDESISKNPPPAQDLDSVEKSEKINELNLTVAKLEATLAEAEDTHIGEISELRAEVSTLEEQVLELQRTLEERDPPGNSSPKLQANCGLENEREKLGKTSSEKVEKLELELKNQQEMISALESKLREAETSNDRMRAEVEQERKEHEKQISLQSQLIATLEQKLRESSRSGPVRLLGHNDGDEDEMRRYSEVTVNGEIDREEEEGRVQSGGQQPGGSKSKKTSKSRSNSMRSKSGRAKKGNGRARSGSHSVGQEARGDEAEDDLNIRPEDHVRFEHPSQSPSLASKAPAIGDGASSQPRKRTTSHRPTNQNRSPNHHHRHHHSTDSGDRSKDQIDLNQQQPPRSHDHHLLPVRRSARNNHSNKKVLSVVEN
ncbi:uncharacterized protein PGTG_14835 [Puccinia graminis f. sp. tritici CRL 75-36-700-3]|uniref:Kinesin-like protein n=1 Tax=Puccinia graminis f. sp. tritici (strain CRL 75-36-700-3 / race SCCL) TaxID=418459 RepID=E3KWF5_PUCGT|nr:uncharacterized protein PGTG_14835 [Puccinia graminis f. sp. tritici CRL 75-36-700-3]EFP88630.2 hypothetical protein PGTG_14835 [Puccinia graminis f. sp. tritici CRL 75-36-700-3]